MSWRLGAADFATLNVKGSFQYAPHPAKVKERGWLVADHTELTKLPTTKLPRSLAAERMRRHLGRRRDGLRCLTLEIRDSEIDALARNGFLKADARNDLYAIEMAMYEFLERALV
jgi:hypothetical protein